LAKVDFGRFLRLPVLFSEIDFHIFDFVHES